MSPALGESDRLTPPRIAPLALLAATLVLAVAGRTPPAGHTSPQGGPKKAAAAPAPPSPKLQWDSWTSVPGPPPLDAASAAYDADDNDVVLFGGRASDGSLSDDTWLWNGKVWDRLPASQTVAPPPREMASMAFDPYLHQLILFGGRGTGGRLLDDTWAWNGYSWYELAGPGPGPRESATLAFDPAGDLVLFGGFGYHEPPSSKADQNTSSTTSPAVAAVLGDTWMWTSSGWIASQATGPEERWGASIGFDPGGRQTVLFGGNSSPPGAKASTLDDTWTWDGHSWDEPVHHVKPPTSGYPTLVEDPDLNTVVLLNSSVAPAGAARPSASRLSLWEWSGTSWVAMSATGGPEGRVGAVATFDSEFSDSGGGSLLYGEGSTSSGAPLGDLWQLVSLPTSGASGASTPTPTSTSTTSTTTTSTTTPPTSLHSEHTAGSLPPAPAGTHPGRRRASGRIIAVMVALAVLIPAVAWLVLALAGRMRRRSSPMSGSK